LETLKNRIKVKRSNIIKTIIPKLIEIITVNPNNIAPKILPLDM